MSTNLANGKLLLAEEQEEDVEFYLPNKLSIYEAQADTTIEYMQFINNTSAALNITVWVQYANYELLFTPKNYTLQTYDVLRLTDPIYLLATEKIMTSCSVNEGVDFMINGTVTGEIDTNLIDTST